MTEDFIREEFNWIIWVMNMGWIFVLVQYNVFSLFKMFMLRYFDLLSHIFQATLFFKKSYMKYKENEKILNSSDISKLLFNF